MCLCPVGELAANETRRTNGGKMLNIVDGERFASNQVAPAQRRSRRQATIMRQSLGWGSATRRRRRRLSGSFVFAVRMGDTGDDKLGWVVAGRKHPEKSTTL